MFFVFLNSFSPYIRFINTESEIRNKLLNLLTELKGFNFVTTLVIGFERMGNYNETKYDTFYLNSQAKTILKESDIDNAFESVHGAIKLRLN